MSDYWTTASLVPAIPRPEYPPGRVSTSPDAFDPSSPAVPQIQAILKRGPIPEDELAKLTGMTCDALCQLLAPYEDEGQLHIRSYRIPWGTYFWVLGPHPKWTPRTPR